MLFMPAEVLAQCLWPQLSFTFTNKIQNEAFITREDADTELEITVNEQSSCQIKTLGFIRIKTKLSLMYDVT